MIIERAETSYRTRRSRGPWFDRPFDRLTVLSSVEGLTTLSEVEGVSRKPSPALDSGQSLRDFRNDEIHAPDQRLVACTTILAKREGRAIYGPYPFPYPLPLLSRLTRAFLIVNFHVTRKTRWIHYIHLNTYERQIWVKSIHFRGPGQGEQTVRHGCSS